MSSHWKRKSEQNIIASNKLKTDTFFCSSVHCSYYSCIQLMYHVLKTHFAWSETKIDEDGYTGSKEVKGGSHIWLITLMFKELSLSNRFEANTFNQVILGLKKLRVSSDYKNTEITENLADNAYSEAQKAISLLKRNFKI